MEGISYKAVNETLRLSGISRFDWDKTKHTLMDMFEFRKCTAKELINCNDEEEIKYLCSMMEYCDNKIKEILYLTHK